MCTCHCDGAGAATPATGSSGLMDGTAVRFNMVVVFFTNCSGLENIHQCHTSNRRCQCHTELDDDNSQAEIGGSAGISSGPTATQNEAHQALANFWPKVTKEINSIQNLDVRCQALPLARIKKIMKLDEDVKMISGEAPVLFAKAAELFIQELTLRSPRVAKAEAQYLYKRRVPSQTAKPRNVHPCIYEN
ncbi:unnamed protein product [Nesidiocoris tenuis]|uniref:Transcription factor CBF/NF-Y/archaeal histone domain-containing protein n=1 Tax=Nesidiocoris tenuis TaxID=355587 RepID=A0A6H5G1T4_9HEMI|nr:unnamed protein product [Nesidiocoris tenuis]